MASTSSASSICTLQNKHIASISPNLKFKSSFTFRLPNQKLAPSTLVKSSSRTPTRHTNNDVVVDEEMERIKRLQNGSDVRGVALEGEKGRRVDLTPPAMEAIAESFGEWVIEGIGSTDSNDKIRVSLGRDPRVSGPALSVAAFSGLARAGCLVFDMGLATTPVYGSGALGANLNQTVKEKHGT